MRYDLVGLKKGLVRKTTTSSRPSVRRVQNARRNGKKGCKGEDP